MSDLDIYNKSNLNQDRQDKNGKKELEENKMSFADLDEFEDQEEEESTLKFKFQDEKAKKDKTEK
jgi:hypothetical protein